MRSCRWSLVALCLVWLVVFLPVRSVAVDRDPTEAFQVMAAAGIDYINNSADCPGVLNAHYLSDDLNNFTVIDIRHPEHFADGHIPGAFNSSLGTLIDDLASSIPSDKPYVIACYTGQSSSQAKMAMELLG